MCAFINNDILTIKIFFFFFNDTATTEIYTLSLHDALPISLRETILDGEAIALRAPPDGTPLPFQVTMRRFGRKLDVDRLRAELPLASFFFDILYADGAPLLDEPYARRFAALEGLVPAAQRVPRIVTADPRQAAAFFQQALAAGHEGLMAKALGARYEAGARGAAARHHRTRPPPAPPRRAPRVGPRGPGGAARVLPAGRGAGRGGARAEGRGGRRGGGGGGGGGPKGKPAQTPPPGGPGPGGGPGPRRRRGVGPRSAWGDA